MSGGIEREGPSGEPKSHQSKPSEQHKPHQEGGKDPPKLQKPETEPKRKPLDPIARAIRDAAQRQGIDLRPLIRELEADLDPDFVELLRRRFRDPSDSSISSEKLQRMFDLPSADEPPSDDKR